jgi:pyridoxine/pyridoxamine 5'-phosphate oxidase
MATYTFKSKSKVFRELVKEVDQRFSNREVPKNYGQNETSLKNVEFMAKFSDRRSVFHLEYCQLLAEDEEKCRD